MSRVARRVATMLAAVVRGALGLVREIGDENAYARYLLAGNRRHSAEEWRTFSDRRLRDKYIRPKCC